jgi:hypothetical protein
MLDSATYYVEYDGGEGRSLVHHDGLQVASFASHDDALRIATHLASSAAELGMYSRVVELGDNRHASIVFERDPIPEADLPWHALGD